MNVVDSLLTLFAASTGLNMAYLALPDYRYRNSISEYFEHHLSWRIHTDDKFKAIGRNDKDQHEVWRWLADARDRQRGNTIGEESWLTFLLEISRLPRGHTPNERIVCPREEGKPTHWLQDLPGKVFRHVFSTHWDNWSAAIIAGVGLIATAAVQVAILYPENSFAALATGFLEGNKGVFLTLGLVGLFLPAILAFVGRVWVCKTARDAIVVAVNQFLSKELDHHLSKIVSNIDELEDTRRSGEE